MLLCQRVRPQETMPGSQARVLFRLINHRVGDGGLLVARVREYRFAQKYKGEYRPFPTFEGFVNLNGIGLED